MSKPFAVIDSMPVAEDVVRTLESALEMARSGSLACVALAYVDREGATGRCWSRSYNRATLVGSVEFLKQDLMAETRPA